MRAHTQGLIWQKYVTKDSKNFSTLKKAQCRQQINERKDVLILEELYNH